MTVVAYAAPAFDKLSQVLCQIYGVQKHACMNIEQGCRSAYVRYCHSGCFILAVTVHVIMCTSSQPSPAPKTRLSVEKSRPYCFIATSSFQLTSSVILPCLKTAHAHLYPYKLVQSLRFIFLQQTVCRDKYMKSSFSRPKQLEMSCPTLRM